MPTLQQMREQQRRDGVVAPPPETDDGGDFSPVGRVLTPTRPVVRQQAGHVGYLRILPPGKNTVAGLSADWIAENWDKPSPWCRVEGAPEHPEFETNLKAFEAAV